MKLKPIHFTKHALLQCDERGTTKDEITNAIRTGKKETAKNGRFMFVSNFAYNSLWNGNFYAIKQVAPVVSVESKEIVVITVYTFYF